MDLVSLRLAGELGGQLLAGPDSAHALLLVERSAGHGLPTLALLGRVPSDLGLPLAMVARAQAAGLPLNLVALLPTGTTRWAAALPHHRRRIGSLVGALDVGLPWLEGRPMMAKRLPGWVTAPAPMPLPPAPLRPLERRELATFLGWEEARLAATFESPGWEACAEGAAAALWPDVPIPEGARVSFPPVVLPSATPFTEALRGALRALGAPVPWLPHPGDGEPLRALLALTPAVAAFQGPEAAWQRAFAQIATLPAPPHFCARC